MVDIAQLPTRRPFHRRRKSDPFASGESPKIDYKDVRLLQRYISERGKITTYRRLAEHAIEKLAPHFPDLKPAWTGEAPLPGGTMPGADFNAYLAELRREAPFLPEATARRLARAYGTEARTILRGARSLSDLGEAFDGGLTAAEVDYLVAREWARSADDILWRRSKLGLRTGPESAARLAAYLTRKAEAA